MVTLVIPNVLASPENELERLYRAVMAQEEDGLYCLDMRYVSFIHPVGVVALIGAARFLSKISGQTVRVINVRPDVLLYLSRMDCVSNCREWLSFPQATDDWARSTYTPNLLELTFVRDHRDVVTVIERAERIFARWLQSGDVYTLLQILSELCANIYQHSGDVNGCVLIQKYDAPPGVVVRVAVGDSGYGVRTTLSRRCPDEALSPLDSLARAFEGYTARPSGRGGLGLRRVRGLAIGTGGHVWIRSESASLLFSGDARVSRNDLEQVPGTQVSVSFRGPMRN